MKDESVITMCIIDGVFIMGKLSGSRLSDPRVFTIFDGGKQMQLAPLPANPPSVVVGPNGIKYEIPSTEKNILALYYKVTHPVQSPVLIPKPVIDLETLKPKLVS